MAVSSLLQSNQHRLIGLMFGLGGLVSSLIFLKFVPSPLHPAHQGIPLYLLIPGVFLTAVLTAGYLTLWKLQLIRTIRTSPERVFFAAILISLTGFCGTLAGLVSGIVTAGLTAQPISRGKVIPPSHPLFHYLLPFVVGLAVGVLVAAVMVCLGLSILTGNWDRQMWAVTMLLSLGLVIGAISVQPGFFDLRRMWTGENSKEILDQLVRSLYILGSGLYGACAGCWLAESGSTD